MLSGPATGSWRIAAHTWFSSAHPPELPSQEVLSIKFLLPKVWLQSPTRLAGAAAGCWAVTTTLCSPPLSPSASLWAPQTVSPASASLKLECTACSTPLCASYRMRITFPWSAATAPLCASTLLTSSSKYARPRKRVGREGLMRLITSFIITLLVLGFVLSTMASIAVMPAAPSHRGQSAPFACASIAQLGDAAILPPAWQDPTHNVIKHSQHAQVAQHTDATARR